jgi:hypothetical protein
VALSGNYEIVAINTDKNTFFNDLDYKDDIGQHFHKSEKSARWRHRHKVIKTNLNPKRCGLFGGVLFGEMKFVLSSFLSNEDLSISYES